MTATAYPQFADGAATTAVSGQLNNTTTPLTFTVASGTGALFPTTFPFYVTVWSQSFADPLDDVNREIIKITGRATDALTGTRGMFGTSAVAHAGTPNVAILVNSGDLALIEAGINALETAPIVTTTAATNLGSGQNLGALAAGILAQTVAGSTATLAIAVADTAYSFIDNALNELRLTTVTLTPVPQADQTAIGTIFLTPFTGQRISLFNGSAWQTLTTAEVSVALSAANSGAGVVSTDIYDVFASISSGNVILTIGAPWTNATTRSAALGRANVAGTVTGSSTTATPGGSGTIVLASNAELRWVGTIRGTGTNTTEDSAANRLVLNATNKVLRHLSVIDSNSALTATSATFKEVGSVQCSFLTDGQGSDQINGWAFLSASGNSLSDLALLSIGSAAATEVTGVMRGGSIQTTPVTVPCSLVEYGVFGFVQRFLIWNSLSGTANINAGPTATLVSQIQGLLTI